MTSQKPTQHADIKRGDAKQAPKTKCRISALAIVSLLLGILILFPRYTALFGFAAVITGVAAQRLIARSPGKLRGHRLATAGIVLGVIGMVFFFAIESLQVRLIRKLPRAWVRPVASFTGMGMAVFGSFRGRLAWVKSDFRTIAMALEAYYQEHNSYPAWAKGEGGANSFAEPYSGAYHIHTFRIWKNENEVGTFYTLTTPLAYMTQYLSDPWADTRGVTYGYYADENGWILYSWGPDTDENEIEDPGDLESDVEQVYRSSISQPSLTLIAGSSSSSHEAYTYDPTNGIISAGDIWRVRQ